MRTIGYLILFLISFSSFAQDVKVVDKETGKPINNVTVFTEKVYFNSSTNSKGIVDISLVKKEDVLFFSHISYALKSFQKATIKNNKFTLINFFASWCSPCRAEHRYLVNLSNEDLDIKIIGINFKDKKKV